MAWVECCVPDTGSSSPRLTVLSATIGPRSRRGLRIWAERVVFPVNRVRVARAGAGLRESEGVGAHGLGRGGGASARPS